MVNDRRWRKAMIDNATGDAMEPLQGSFHFVLLFLPRDCIPGLSICNPFRIMQPRLGEL